MVLIKNRSTINVVAPLLVVTLCVSAMFRPAVAGQAVTVISPKDPLPNVVTTDTKTDRDAAADLCDYLSRVSGRKVTVSAEPAQTGVIIHVGRDEFASKQCPQIDTLFADGFIIKSIESDGRQHIVLSGKLDRASQWAVEQFLKDYCGVRWLFPDPVYGEVVPFRPTITVAAALSKTYEPDYHSRSNCQMYYFGSSPDNLRLGPHGYPYGSHQMQHIFSTEEFKAHPEWFAFFKGDGNRGKKAWVRQWWKYGNGWQICTSNPETVEHAVNYVLEQIREKPDVPIVSVGHNDGAGWCECPDCKTLVNSFSPPLTLSERWWHWVNQVAREVAKTDPEKWVESMAYSQSSRLPRFTLEPNVAITKTIVLSDEIKLAEDWGKLCKSVNLYSYMYGAPFIGFRHYPHAARDFLKWGHEKLGARGHVAEVYGDWTFDGPKYYYLQALQWDVNANVDAIMDDFCQASYGKAAGPMQAFWDRLEQIYERRRPVPNGEQNRRLLFYQWVGWANNDYIEPNEEFREYTLEDIEVLDKNIVEATGLAAEDTKEVKFRCERLADAWKYFRTVLVSYLEFYSVPSQMTVDSDKTRQATLTLARRIADERATRTVYLARLQAYPRINPRMARNYWSWSGELTLFNHETALIDEWCTSVSEYVKATGGMDAALDFWRAVGQTDNLYETAQSQIYILSRDELPNLLANGDFESGGLQGWDGADGTIVSEDKVHAGTYSARMTSGVLSKRIKVSPLASYRLTVWGRYLTKPVDWTVRLESNLAFYSGDKRLWTEPMRSTSVTAVHDGGWVRLRSTVTAPSGADGVVIKLRKTFNEPCLWDDVTFEKIKDGAKVKHGRATDDFGGDRVDRDKWARATDSHGTVSPIVKGGWLNYDMADSCDLTSLARFDDLLKHEGNDRYRLRVHAKSLGATARPSTFTWGIKTGTGIISIIGSGLFWSHHFASAENPISRLEGHSSQGGKLSLTDVYTGSSSTKTFEVKQLKRSSSEVWYTLYFDPKDVTVYASANGYDESDDALVATYKHEISDITADGSVYLKLCPGVYALDEIRMSCPALTADKGQPER